MKKNISIMLSLTIFITLFYSFSASASYRPDEEDVFHAKLNAPRIYMGNFLLEANIQVYKIETMYTTGDPVMLVIDKDGNLLNSDDDSGKDLNARTYIYKNKNEAKEITVILLSYDESLAGETYLRLSKYSSGTYKEDITLKGIKFGGLPIITSWNEGDIIRGTGDYKSMTLDLTCKEAGYNNTTTCLYEYRYRCEDSEDYNMCVHKEVCKKAGGIYEGINDYSDLCEFGSYNSDLMVLGINNWTKPTRSLSYNFWYSSFVNTKKDLVGMNDDSGAGRSFKLIMDRQSGSSSALIVGLYPWVISDGCKDSKSCLRYVTQSPWSQYYRSPLSGNIRVYKDRIVSRRQGIYSDQDYDGISYKLERKIGTEPNVKDTDQDGINDFFELFGYDICLHSGSTSNISKNSNLTTCNFKSIPFYQLGADPTIQDIFIEIDYMPTKTNNNLQWISKPSDKNLRKFNRTFLDIEKNEGQISGMRFHKKRIHIDMDDELPMSKFKEVVSFDLHQCSSTPDNCILNDRFGASYRAYDYKHLKDKYMDDIRQIFYHYVFAAPMTWYIDEFGNGRPIDSTGRGEIVGNDINLACPIKIYLDTGEIKDDTNVIQLGIFMHEFGHNLGLLHNGNTSIDGRYSNINDRYYFTSSLHKSVMNTRYTKFGINGDFQTFTYSTGSNYLSRSSYYEQIPIKYYTSENGTAYDNYSISNGISFTPVGTCFQRNSNKTWNDSNVLDSLEKLNCQYVEHNIDSHNDETRIKYQTCDCDVQEWQNLKLDFKFNYDGDEDEDLLGVYDPDPEKIYFDYQVSAMSQSNFKNKIDEMFKKVFYKKLPYFNSNGRKGEYTVNHHTYRILSE